MDAKTRALGLSVAVAAVLWYIGGFLVNNSIGIALVALGIAIAGYGVGNLMNSPEPSQD